MKKPLKEIIESSLFKTLKGPRAKRLANHHLGQWKADIEPRIYDQQHDYIKKNYGQKAADDANYGWSAESDEKDVNVSTKVYGKNPRVISSYARYPNKKADHSDDDY